MLRPLNKGIQLRAVVIAPDKAQMLQEANLTELYERDIFYIVKCFCKIFAASANFHIVIAYIPVIAEVSLDN